jgi:hypothetical protein
MDWLPGLALVASVVFVLMRRGVFGQPGISPMHDVRRVLKWAAIALALLAIPMLSFVSLIVYADYSISRPAEALPAVLPILLVVAALVVGLLVVFVRQRPRHQTVAERSPHLVAYRGSSRAQARQLFATDAERARTAGYAAVTETWTEDDEAFVLTAEYVRASVK